MKESQCLLHLQRLFWTPFCLYFSARRPREILAAVRACASRDDTICSKNRNFDPYHRDKARSRAYGLLPLWLLILSIIAMGATRGWGSWRIRDPPPLSEMIFLVNNIQTI